MKAEIKIPAMGESISEATIGEILKPSGSKVAVDDEILELETDKVNQVLYASQAGILNLTVNPGDVVKIGQLIGAIDSAGVEKVTAHAKAEAPKKEEKPVAKAPATLAPAVATSAPKAAAPKAAPAPTAAAPAQAPVAAASGSIRRGKDAFVADVIGAPWADDKESVAPAKGSETAVARGAAPAAKPGERETRRKMSNVRKVIAKRLVEVHNTTAMLTTFNEVDLSAVMAIRAKHKDAFEKQHGAKLGFMSFFVKAAVAALQEFPDLNSYIDGEEIVHREYYDIGIAVGTDRGLFVPVLRDCHSISFVGIEQGIEGYAKKAREGKLVMDDLQGGGFTITNGGVYGSLLSTPILNPPQSGILGMHKIEKRPVVVDDQIVIRPMMYLALSYDHRIVDGKEAVSFLVHVKNSLEDPSRMLLQV